MFFSFKYPLDFFLPFYFDIEEKMDYIETIEMVAITINERATTNRAFSLRFWRYFSVILCTLITLICAYVITMNTQVTSLPPNSSVDLIKTATEIPIVLTSTATEHSLIETATATTTATTEKHIETTTTIEIWNPLDKPKSVL